MQLPIIDVGEIKYTKFCTEVLVEISVLFIKEELIGFNDSPETFKLFVATQL
jgi:hypothetical protein